VYSFFFRLKGFRIIWVFIVLELRVLGFRVKCFRVSPDLASFGASFLANQRPRLPRVCDSWRPAALPGVAPPAQMMMEHSA
jgi:hypothetical protein